MKDYVRKNNYPVFKHPRGIFDKCVLNRSSFSFDRWNKLLLKINLWNQSNLAILIRKKKQNFRYYFLLFKSFSF